MKTATKKTGKKTTTKAKATKTAKPKAEAKPKRTSALDAAAQVLRDAKEPMQVRAMVEAMKAKGLWSSDAATPRRRSTARSSARSKAARATAGSRRPTAGTSPLTRNPVCVPPSRDYPGRPGRGSLV